MEHKNLNKAQAANSDLGAVSTRLTPAQKRELELLKVCGGSCHVYDGRLLRVFHALQDKGFVKCESAFGQFQKGTRIEKRDFFEVFLERQLEVDGEPYSEAVAKQLPVADYYIIMEVLDNMLKALKPNFL